MHSLVRKASKAKCVREDGPQDGVQEPGGFRTHGVEMPTTHKVWRKSQAVVKVRAAGNKRQLSHELQGETKPTTIPCSLERMEEQWEGEGRLRLWHQRNFLLHRNSLHLQ